MDVLKTVSAPIWTFLSKKNPTLRPRSERRGNRCAIHTRARPVVRRRVGCWASRFGYRGKYSERASRPSPTSYANMDIRLFYKWPTIRHIYLKLKTHRSRNYKIICTMSDCCRKNPIICVTHAKAKIIKKIRIDYSDPPSE